MEQESPSQKVLVNLPSLWLHLTIIYILLNYATGLIVRISGFLGLGILYITRFVGLFVPIGPLSFISSLSNPNPNSLIKMPALIIFPLVLVTIFGGEYLLKKLKLPPLVRFLINIFILFMLTIAVDFIIWQHWLSWGILMMGGKTWSL